MRLTVITPRTPPPCPAGVRELEAENPTLFHLWLRSGQPLGPYLTKRGRSLSTPLLSRTHRITCAVPPAPQDWPLAGRQEACRTVPGPGVVSRLQPDASQHSPMPHWQGLATPMAGSQSHHGLHHDGSQPSPMRPWRELAQPRQGHHSTPLAQPQQQWSEPQPQPQPQQRLPQQWQQPPLSQLSQLSQLSPAPPPQQWQLTPSPQCPPPPGGGLRLQLAPAPTLTLDPGARPWSSQPTMGPRGELEPGPRQAHSQPKHDYQQEALAGRGDQPDAWPAAGLGLGEVRWPDYDVGYEPARSSSLHLSGSTPPPASSAAPVGSLPLSSSSTRYSTPPPASAPARVGALRLSDGMPPPVSAAEVARLPCATQQRAAATATTTRPTHARPADDCPPNCPPHASATPAPSKPAQAFDVLMAAQKHLGSAGAPASPRPGPRPGPRPDPRPDPCPGPCPRHSRLAPHSPSPPPRHPLAGAAAAQGKRAAPVGKRKLGEAAARRGAREQLRPPDAAQLSWLASQV